MHVPPKLGPLPTWAWGLVLLGGLGLGLYLRRHSSSSPTASVVSAGGPIPTLGAAGGGSDGGTSGVSTGMDPILAGLLSDSNSALVNESGIFAGLTAQSVQGALDASQAVLSTGERLATTPPYTTTPVVVVVGSSPAGAGPAGTTSAPPAPVAPPAPYSPAQATASAEFKARQAAATASGHWTAGL